MTTPAGRRPRRALIALGSNLGDREANIRGAVEMLGGDDVRVLAASALEETQPVGGPPQGLFLNGAVLVETELAPGALLERLHRIEDRLGRARADERWGPRTVDLDLLLFDDEVLDARGVTVPHPRMPERRFVLGPAAEIAPDMVHPLLDRTVKELLEALP